MKKITIISQYWEPDFNGDVVRLKRCIEAFIKLGYKVDLITAIPNYIISRRNEAKVGLEFGKNLRILRLWMPKIEHNSFAKRLLIYLWFMLVSSIPAIIFARKGYIWAFCQRVFSTYSCLIPRIIWKTKLISDVTDVWPEALVNTGYLSSNSISYKLGKLVALIAYRISDNITTLNPAMASLIIKNYGVNEAKVKIVPNIAENMKVNPNLKNENFNIVYFGNLGTNYDFKILLDTAKILEESGVNLVIRGNGEMLEYVKEYIKIKNINNVKLITKILSQDEMIELLNDASLLILPMKEQIFENASFPIKFVEYLNTGIPVLYIGKGYAYDIIENYKAGIAIDKRDPKLIAEYIIELKNDKEKLLNIMNSSILISRKMFSEDALIEKIKEVFS